MEKKFTKGEWVVAPNAFAMANCIWVGGSRIAVIDEFPHEGSEYNARLIAAAPDLLEALEAALTELEQFIPVTDVKVIDKVKAAISKALNIK